MHGCLHASSLLHTPQATAYISAGDPEAPVPAVVTTEEGSAKQVGVFRVVVPVPVSLRASRTAQANSIWVFTCGGRFGYT